MDLLVSDYDGTLYTDKTNLKANIEALQGFIKNGNKFVIATAREYTSIKKEIDYYKIPCDYLICNVGGVILYPEGEVLFANVMDKEDFEQIKDILKNDTIVFYGLHGLQKEAINVVEIAILDEKNHLKGPILQAKFPYCRIEYSNGVTYIKKDIDKSRGIKKLIEKEQLDFEHIYTVGDSENDLEMLVDYEGYRIGQSDALEPYNIEQVESVKSLIYRIGCR